MGAGDDKKFRLTPEGKFGLQIVLPCTGLVFATFAFLGQLEIGMGVGIAMLSLMIAIKATWQYHEYRWYWIAVAVAALLQIPMIFHAQLLSNQTIKGKGFLLFGYVDFFAVWGCIVLAKKLMGRSDEDNAPSEE